MRRSRKARFQNLPPLSNRDLDAWLTKNSEDLFCCPHQPGNLRLTAAACAKRYNTANEPRWANIGAEPFPIFVIKMNLIPCRKCELGAKMARKHQEKAA